MVGLWLLRNLDGLGKKKKVGETKELEGLRMLEVDEEKKNR